MNRVDIIVEITKREGQFLPFKTLKMANLIARLIFICVGERAEGSVSGKENWKLPGVCIEITWYLRVYRGERVQQTRGIFSLTRVKLWRSRLYLELQVFQRGDDAVIIWMAIGTEVNVASAILDGDRHIGQRGFGLEIMPRQAMGRGICDCLQS